ncbi:MAG: type II secretion system protein [Sedimentisphaerales bacterium]
MYKLKKIKGFTLVELLVVISIIALLLAILMPALSKARESGNKVVCASNGKQLYLATACYVLDNRNKIPYHCGSDPASVYYDPYNSYSIHHISIPPGDLIQGLGRLYGKYTTDPKIYFCPSTRDGAFQFPKMSKADPLNPDSTFQLNNNYWVGTGTLRMPGRSTYIYRGGDFDPAKVHPTKRKLYLDLSTIKGSKAFAADIWTLANSRPLSISHKDGINAIFTDGHVGWNRIKSEDLKRKISSDVKDVLKFWEEIDNTMN